MIKLFESFNIVFMTAEIDIKLYNVFMIDRRSNRSHNLNLIIEVINKS